MSSDRLQRPPSAGAPSPASNSIRNSDNANNATGQPTTERTVVNGSDSRSGTSNAISAPSITLPQGGGAVRSVSEKFDINLSSGSGTYTIALPTTAARSGSSFQDAGISLQYSSNSGNGVFGEGWDLSMENARISRQYDRGMPRYRDTPSKLDDQDTFILNGLEDLVRTTTPSASQAGYTVKSYHPRIEGAFLRIEWWINDSDPGDSYWKVTSQNNIVGIYGRDKSARILQNGKADQPDKVFAWLLSERYDTSGNAIIYNYKEEDAVGIPPELQLCEQNRSDDDRTAQKYIKSIKYGNRIANRNENTWDAFSAFTLDPSTWMFEVVFDYGEHSLTSPRPGDSGVWKCRQDPFSSYRSGFEVRTYRLCNRVLLFHHFPDKFNGQEDVLVTSWSFEYEENPVLTYLIKVTQTGYDTDESSGSLLSSRSLPSLTFDYTRFPNYDNAVLPHHKLVRNSDIGFPVFANSKTTHQWIDLDGEGIPGILYTDATTKATYYCHNLSGLGEVKFEPPKALSTQPSLPVSQGVFMDVAGNGTQDLVDVNTPGLKGYYERKHFVEPRDDGWGVFHPFQSFPNIQSTDYQLIDLSGDGLADILLIDDQIFKWYSCLPFGEGYSPNAEWKYGDWEENRSPRVVFTASNDIRVFLADASGDGLVDIVRVRRDGEVCYWPNLGYANWGGKILLGRCEWPDAISAVDLSRVYLADIDGSGTSDIVYVSDRAVALYRNQNGNALAAPLITPFTPINGGRLDFVDLFGNGTDCLVLSSSTDDYFTYLDFCGGVKPHLLQTVDNGVGVQRTLTYAASTKFYLQDKLNNRPWITRLSFPINCVESAEIFDSVSGNKFFTRYEFHHGYYDGVEREFRGFAAVDAYDTEENTEGLSWTHGPSSHVKTWFHTGAFLENQEISRQLAREYFGAPSPQDSAAFQEFLDSLLPDTVIPVESTNANWSADDIRQACRSLKGATLRREIYGEDLSLNSKAAFPFQVTETNFTIRKLDNTVHSVFFTHQRETLTYNYERQMDDGRVGHNIVISVDNYGNILQSFQVAYGRAASDLTDPGDKMQQENNSILFSSNNFTDPVIDSENYQLPKAAETLEYQIHDPTLITKRGRLTFDDLLPLPQKPDILYTAPLNGGILNGKRKIEHSVTLYRKDDLSALLPKNKIETLGLPGENYRLAVKSDIFDHAYQDVQDSEFTISKMLDSGYVDVFGDGNYWIASGRQYYADTTNSADELVQAKKSFFLPVKFVDPLGHATTIEYDAGNLLRTVKSVDALGNEINATLNYRVVQYESVTDVNGNTSQAKHDELGRVIASAISGKSGEGDSFNNFTKYPSQTLLDAFEQNPQSSAAQDLLGSASGRQIYNTSKVPIHVYSIIRNTHESDLPSGTRTDVQVQVSYTDGLGRVIQSMGQCEPSTINDDEPGTPDTPGKTWICSGWVIYNSKGLPVRQFEPFYNDSHVFTHDAIHGVSPYIFYDAMGRTVGQFNANHSWAKTTFSPWMQSVYDENDTVQVTPDPNDPRTDPDVGGYFKLFTPAELGQTWYAARTAPGTTFGPQDQSAARKAAVHNNTPAVSHFNALGQQFLTVSKIAAKYSDTEVIPTFELTQRLVLDIEGNTLEAQDANGWAVERSQYDMLGTVLFTQASDNGRSWMHQNCLGSPVYHWDDRRYRTRQVYDALNRAVEAFVLDQEGQPTQGEKLVEKIVYGETNPDPADKNTRTKVVQHFDQAGVISTNQYDFKGNQLLGRRQYAADYKNIVDHSTAFTPDSRLPVVETDTTYDAQNRILTITSPTIDNLNSTVFYTYNRTGLLSTISTRLKSDSAASPIIRAIRYNARGQRYGIDYGNSSGCQYTYDPYTFQLTRAFTKRGSRTDFPDDCPDPQNPNNPGCQIQNSNYTYDAANNLTFTEDKAQQAIFFRGNRVDPSCDYTYDSVYRLIRATGREHLGQPNTNGPKPPSPGDPSTTRIDLPTNSQALGTYIERFYYDNRNNLQQVRHEGSDPIHPGWTRDYFYNEPNPLQPAGANPPWRNNRLSYTQIGTVQEVYRYDGRPGRGGNITGMPATRSLQWDWKNQLQASAQQVFNNGTPETTYYVYSASGTRIRKVTEYQTPNGQDPLVKSDRIYVGTIFERYVTYLPQANASPSRIEETIQVYDGTRRVAGIEFIRDFTGAPDPPETRLFRYQLSNFTQSSAIELDDKANVISYEEYFPHGSTSYQGVRSQLEIPKRYRFASKERDNETGLDYYGARYYAPWIGRWISPDPGGLIDGSNRYAFVGNNPVGVTDPSGFEGLQLTEPKLTVKGADSDKAASGGSRVNLLQGMHLSLNSPQDISLAQQLQQMRDRGLMVPTIWVFGESSDFAVSPFATFEERYQWVQKQLNSQPPTESKALELDNPLHKVIGGRDFTIEPAKYGATLKISDPKGSDTPGFTGEAGFTVDDLSDPGKKTDLKLKVKFPLSNGAAFSPNFSWSHNDQEDKYNAGFEVSTNFGGSPNTLTVKAGLTTITGQNPVEKPKETAPGETPPLPPVIPWPLVPNYRSNVAYGISYSRGGTTSPPWTVGLDVTEGGTRDGRFAGTIMGTFTLKFDGIPGYKDKTPAAIQSGADALKGLDKQKGYERGWYNQRPNP
ncbi:hypothetical protein Dda_3455 [Drechslerella dactyloides]|uniref:Uncharacterized protein n=1 Tax=Drechslerella dactyloides TaxID=74499 RepID=A0AAD6NMU9_DREDA|nr:hypothetical protein Dda_3455 [Drechslerella dactyloides]